MIYLGLWMWNCEILQYLTMSSKYADVSNMVLIQIGFLNYCLL